MALDETFERPEPPDTEANPSWGEPMPGTWGTAREITGLPDLSDQLAKIDAIIDGDHFSDPLAADLKRSARRLLDVPPAMARMPAPGFPWAAFLENLARFEADIVRAVDAALDYMGRLARSVSQANPLLSELRGLHKAMRALSAAGATKTPRWGKRACPKCARRSLPRHLPGGKLRRSHTDDRARWRADRVARRLSGGRWRHGGA